MSALLFTLVEVLVSFNIEPIFRNPATTATVTQKKNCYPGGLFLVYPTFVCLMLILRDFFDVVIVLF